METKNPPLKINLIQPNKVTNARHDFNERQENILTLMIDAVQKHMTKQEHIQTDLFGSPMITIDLKSNGLDNHKQEYHESALGMIKKTFEFEYTNPDGCEEEVAGVLITTVRHIKGKSVLELTINQWAIPYLLYWGKGVGGTVFNKMIALTIKGEYPKRLYKLCKRWEDRGGFAISIDEFRQMLAIENKYKTNKDLKKLLKRCQEKLMEDADVYFNFDFEKLNGSRSANMIHFTILGNNKKRPKHQKTDMYVRVYGMLSLAFPTSKSSMATDVANKLADKPENLERFYHRTKRLKNELDDGTKTITDVVKLIKHILKNDYSIHS
jgi:plasmid replication initiation protein